MIEAKEFFSTSEIEPENEQIRYFENMLNDRKRGLRFPADLETSFQHYYDARYYRHMRNVIFYGVGIFCLSHLLNNLLFPASFDVVSGNWLWMLPLMVSFVGICFYPHFQRIQQYVLMALGIVLLGGLMLVTYQIPEPVKTVYISGISVVLIFSLGFSRIQFRNALYLALITFVGFNTLLFYTEQSYALRIAFDYVYAATLLLLLVSSYAREASVRESYLRDRILMIKNQVLEKMNNHLMDLANVDGLTGIANFRYFERVLENEWKRAHRYHYPLSLLLIDFDCFKTLNDTYGHQVGDYCLQRVAQIIEKFGRRAGDIAARQGGDEFVLLLTDVKEENALSLAEDLRKAVEELNIPNEKSTVKPMVTLTIGVSTLVPNQKVQSQDLRKFADDALYHAKLHGRNCVGAAHTNVMNRAVYGATT